MERAQLLSVLIGPQWSSYARGLEPQALLNRLAFAVAHQIEATLETMTAWRFGDED